MRNILFGMNIVALLSLIGFISLGVWDLYRLAKGIPTITSVVRDKLSNHVLSTAIYCVLVGLVWWMFGANVGVLSIGMGLAAHLTLWR